MKTSVYFIPNSSSFVSRNALMILETFFLKDRELNYKSVLFSDNLKIGSSIEFFSKEHEYVHLSNISVSGNAVSLIDHVQELVLITHSSKSQENLLFILQNFPYIHFIHEVIVDDGFLSYASRRLKRLSGQFSRFEESKKTPSLRFLLRYHYKKLKRRLSFKRFCFKHRMTFTSEQVHLLTVKASGPPSPLQSIFLRHSQKHAHEVEVLLTEYSDVCILADQDFLKYLDRSKCKALLSNTLKVLKSRFRTVFIKNHPKDPSSLWDSFIDGTHVQYLPATDLLIEDLCVSERVTSVAGFTSTSLLTAQQIFGKASFSFAKSLQEATSHPFVQQHCKEFIEFSKSFPEIKHITKFEVSNDTN